MNSSIMQQLSSEQSRLLADQSDHFTVTLESTLATLRSSRLSDRVARAMAIDIAAGALVTLRERTDRVHSALFEPVSGAFSRLRDDLRPLVRHSDLDVQFVEPPATGRALPGEVAHTSRAIVRAAVLALVHEGQTRRVRIQWDCDGLNLLIAIRDDGRGELTTHDDAIRPIVERVTNVGGTFEVSSTPGWGSELHFRIPLDPPASTPPRLDVALSGRESEVLHLVSQGHRNREIASELGVSENTVKFHVSNLLRKAGVKSRGELIALSHQ